MKPHTRNEIIGIILLLICWFILSMIGISAAKANIDWLVEAADIAKIIAPLVLLLVFYKMKKSKK